MGASAAALNQALDAWDGGATDFLAYMSLHDGDPGTTGANEFSGGGYARVAVSFNAASGAVKTTAVDVSFTTDGVTEATHFGFWPTLTGGTFGIGDELTDPVTGGNIVIAAGAASVTAAFAA